MGVDRKRSKMNSLWWYIKNARKELLVGAKTVGVIKADETVSKREFRDGLMKS